MMLGMHPWIGLADDVRLGLLTEWVTAELVDEVLAECGTRDQRPGALPARFMVYYVLALALCSRPFKVSMKVPLMVSVQASAVDASAYSAARSSYKQRLQTKASAQKRL